MFSAIDSVLVLFSDIMKSLVSVFLKWVLNVFGVSSDFLQSAQYNDAVSFFFYDTAKIFLMISVIIFVVSILRSFFSPEKTRRFLGEGKARGILGHAAASLLGIATPFCSCSAVPLFIGFIEGGVPLGVTFSFLVSSPMINEVALVLLWGLFGWKIALIYLVSGLSIAIVTGLIIGKLKLEKYVEDYVYAVKIPKITESAITWKTRFSESFSYVGEILRKIWIYIIIGIAIGALMHGWAPSGLLTAYAGKENPFAVILAVAVGVPLYSNAAGIIPIVSELIRLGMPIGTALAFMMSVTALSLPEMIILRKVLKPRLLAVFIGIMALAISFTGYLFNYILG